MAPEQTGRMNRSIDPRSDLYSLGVTYYEMLVGGLPFTAGDAMEWIHCHIARLPVSPCARVHGIPGAISAIVMKLLAKAAEERFQTAAGVEADLRHCLSALETHGQIELFPLGACDVPDRLLVSEKLYGREEEIKLLLASFARVVGGGRPELVLVSGYSGVGKYDQIWSLLGARQIEELVDLPLITNPDVLDVLDVLTATVMSANFTDENLLALLLCRMVSLSLEHGNSDAACFAYVSLGMIAGPQFGNYEAGFQFGKLGYDLVEKRGLHRYQARTYLRFGDCVMPWKRHVKTGRELVRRAFDVANRVGDLTFAGYSCNNLHTNLLAAGDPLAEVQREAETGLEFAEKVRFGRVIDQIKTQLALIRTLRGLKPKFGSFNDDYFDELQFERHLSSNPTLTVPECWYWIRKLQARFFAGDYSSAIQASSNAKRLLWTSHSYFEVAEYHFYSALARAGAFDSATEGSRQEHFKALADHHRQLAIWAENAGRISKTAPHWWVRKSPGSKAATATPCASTSGRSVQHTPTASCTMRPLPTNWRRSTIWRVVLKRLDTPISAARGTVTTAGAPTAKCRNSIGFIRIRPHRRGSLLSHSTPPSARRSGSWTLRR
jgi:hypothetical protein